MSVTLSGPAMYISNVAGDSNFPSLYFIAQADFDAFSTNYGSSTSMDYYDNTGAYVGNITLTNLGTYNYGKVNMPATIQSTGIYHVVDMSTGSWYISDDDLATVTAAITAATSYIVPIEGATAFGPQLNYPTHTDGVILLNVNPLSVNLKQICNIIPNQYNR